MKKKNIVDTEIEQLEEMETMAWEDDEPVVLSETWEREPYSQTVMRQYLQHVKGELNLAKILNIVLTVSLVIALIMR